MPVVVEGASEPVVCLLANVLMCEDHRQKLGLSSPQTTNTTLVLTACSAMSAAVPVLWYDLKTPVLLASVDQVQALQPVVMSEWAAVSVRTGGCI